MNSNCATCGKTVYPTEKLQAIDKTFHKLCFKCTECSLVLSLKTFQSFESKPYCRAHTPKPVASNKGNGGDSLEMQRLKNVHNMVSNVQYRAEYEKSRGDQGSFASAALEAPQIKMNMKNSSQVSQVKYNQNSHGTGGDQQQQHPQQQANLASMNSAVSSGPTTIKQEGGKVYRALYTYTPTAEDELGFEVGDEIGNVQQVADGWLFGTNSRTGHSGLLPEPYCEPTK